MKMEKVNIKEVLGREKGDLVKQNINLGKNVIEDNKVTILNPIVGVMVLENKDNDVLAQFNLKVQAQFTCDRCLKKFTKELNLKFIQKYSFKSKSEEILPIFPDQTINIEEPIRQELISNLSYKNICNENCRGLCNKCGSDLNKFKCNCN